VSDPGVGTREWASPDLPVRLLPGEEGEPPPVDGVGLCLSGGGYRAMLFHLGALRRLNEAGWLPRLDRVSSVSGGSLTAGALGLAWDRLSFAGEVATNFTELVVDPVRGLAAHTVDVGAVLGGVLSPGSIADHAAAAYREHLLGEATLRDLPDEESGPRFIFNATSVKSGALWRFSRSQMADWRVGSIIEPDVQLADAAAASAAFPPILSPFTLDLEGAEWITEEGNDLTSDDFRGEAVLTDGGVYDNLGLETAWKRCRTILVSDAGGALTPEADPDHDWARHFVRITKLIDNQVRALRKQQAISAFQQGDRAGAYWGIRSDISHYGLADALAAPYPTTMRLAAVPTRLHEVDDRLQECLINWGYAICDAGMRSHVDQTLPKPTGFPYPEAGLDPEVAQVGA
jgi:NTE family protein